VKHPKTTPPFRRTPYVLAAFLSFVGAAWGQVNPGLPSFSASDSHVVDTVNLQNLSISLNVPVMRKSGAFPFAYSLMADSYVYQTTGRTGPTWGVSTGLVGSANGSIINQPALGETTGSAYLCPDGVTYTYKESNWFIQLADGTKHYLPTADYVDSDGCWVGSFTDLATDNSGYTLSITSGDNPSYIVYDKSGMELTIPPTLKVTGMTDPNGNVVSVSGTSPLSYTDTLGETSLTTGTGTYIWTDVNGGSPQVSITNTSMSVASNFACSGIGDYAASTSLPTTLSFPDGTTLGIAYEGMVGQPGFYTGRIGEITLRQGGTVTYAYTGSNNGINCTYQMPNGMTRTTSDGTTKYALAFVNNSGGNYGETDTVTDQGGNNTVYTFTGLTATGNAAPPITQALTEVQHYQGSGTLLSTDVYCYNTAFASCSFTSAPKAVVTAPISKVVAFHKINGMSNTSATETHYDTYGNVTYSAQYDFGGSSPVRATTITYGSCSAGCTGSSPTISSVGSHVNNKPGDVLTTLNGSSVAESRFTYDTKGNLLTTYNWNGSSWSSNPTANSYNSNGTIATSYDLSGNATTYAYNGTGGCNNMLLTSVTTGGLTTSKTWNCTGGVPLTSKDASGNTTTYGYVNSSGTADPLWRVMSVTDRLGNEIWQTYPSGSSPNTIGSNFTFNSGNSVQNTTKTTDGYGRTINVQKQQGPSATRYDTVSTEYGWSGNYRTVTVTLPCSTTSGAQCSFSSGETITNLNPLGQPYTVTDGGGGVTTITYPQNDVLTVLGPAPSGENVKQVQKQYDGLGRPTFSCKIESSGGTSCGQGFGSASGVVTTTTYTSTTGSQTVTRTRGSQSRSKTLDGLGRVTQTVTPEGGTWTYTYDTPCSSSYKNTAGRLTQTLDPNLNKLCYSYDTLGRVTLVNANGTTCRHFYYDNSSGYSGTIPTGITLSNQYGRMVEAATDSCSSGTLITDEWFAFDKDGNRTSMWELTPHSTQYYQSTATFFGNGVPATVDLASPSLYTMTYGLDGEGRMSTLTDTTANQSIVTGTTFFPAANPAVVSLTGTDNDAYTYDWNTGRMTKFVFTVGSNNLTGNLDWNPNGTLGYLAVTDGFNSEGSETCYSNSSGSLGYGYDDLGRLVEFDCGSGNWGQQFSYDQYDNLTKTVLSGRTGTSWNPGYSATTNHCTGCTYDSNGDVTGDGNDVYGWNEFSKIKWTATSGTPTCGTSGRCATYDAFGRMVESSAGSTWKEYWYTQAGKAVIEGTTVIDAYWPTAFGMAIINGTTGFGYMHNDWRGSARITSSVPYHDEIVDQGYTPYGEIFNVFGPASPQYQMFGSTLTEFAPGTTTPIMWDTPNRELSYAGRWLSPDPAGSGWNQYAYPTNPNSNVDPSGLAVYPIDAFLTGAFNALPSYAGQCGDGCISIGELQELAVSEQSVGADSDSPVASGGCSGCSYGTMPPACTPDTCAYDNTPATGIPDAIATVPTTLDSFYSGSLSFGFYSQSLTYVPSTNNLYYGVGTGSPGLSLTMGNSTNANGFSSGPSANGCFFFIVGGCRGVSSSGDVANQYGFGLGEFGASVTYGIDPVDAILMGMYNGTPADPLATIYVDGLGFEDPYISF
jgi:YD repeat-containing protein